MAADIKDIIAKASSNSGHEKQERSSGIKDVMNTNINFFKKGIKDKQKQVYYSDLYTLLNSGVDIKTALEIMEEKQTKDKELINTIYNNVVKGESLSEAMKLTSLFSQYEYQSIKIGEETGYIINVLKELNSFYMKKLKQRRLLTNALSYPLFVLLTAFGTVIFMLKFIVPMFVDIFKRFDNDLPHLTKVVMDISDLISNNIWILLLAITAIFVLFILIRKQEWYRNISSKILLVLPIVGPLFKKIYLARFCQAMALLVGAKTPILKSIELVKEMIQFYPYEKALHKVEKDILGGKTLNKSLSPYSIFDKHTLALIKVGEEVNELDKTFNTLNEHYTEELDHRMSVISSLLEPVLIVVVGGLVAVILIAMYLPLFSIGTTIS